MSDPWGIPGQGADPSGQTGDPFETQPPTGQFPPQFIGDAGVGTAGPVGDPQYPYPQPRDGYPMPPMQKQSNDFAISGFFLSILFWPLGLILSIIGLVRSGKLGGAGKKYALSGLILSIVFCALSIFLIAKISGSTAEDPGCTTAEASVHTFGPEATSIESQISTDGNSGDIAALKTDLNSLIMVIQTAQSDLNHSESVAVHQQVKTQIATVNNDLTALISAFQALSSGDASQMASIETALPQMQTDATDLDTLCDSY